MDLCTLIALCEAYKFYESGYISLAYDRINNITFLYDSDYISKQSVREFKKQVQEEFKLYKHQMEIKKEQEQEKRIISEIPYVGMPETRIADTSLGAPSGNIRHNIAITNGERFTANLYDFYKNGARIFTARCVNGVVTEIWDDRYTTTSSYKPNSQKKTEKKALLTQINFPMPKIFMTTITMTSLITMTQKNIINSIKTNKTIIILIPF